MFLLQDAGASALSAQEQEFLKKYGKLPPKKDIAKKRMNKTAVCCKDMPCGVVQRGGGL
jgi:hypothetical protein